MYTTYPKASEIGQREDFDVYHQVLRRNLLRLLCFAFIVYGEDDDVYHALCISCIVKTQELITIKVFLSWNSER